MKTSWPNAQSGSLTLADESTMSTATYNPSTIRVALFTDTDALAAAERHMLDLARALRDIGSEPQIICPASSPLAERAAANAIDLLPLPKGAMVNRQAIRTLAQLLRSGQLDLIHAHNGHTTLNAVLAVRSAGKGQCISTQHFLPPNHATPHGIRGFISRQARHWIAQRVAHYIAISETARQHLIARDPSLANKITVIPNGIVPPNPATLTPPSAIRRELNIPPDSPLIVCVSRLSPEKDLSSLITAMSAIATRYPAARCLILGQGEQQSLLQSQIVRRHLETKVQLLGFRPDAHAIIQAGDIFVLPSLAEPFGRVLLEAMALKKPAIAIRAGSPIEIVRDGITGLLIPPSDPPSLAGAMAGLLDNLPGAAAIGENGCKRFLEQFTAERMALATCQLYQAVLNRS